MKSQKLTCRLPTGSIKVLFYLRWHDIYCSQSVRDLVNPMQLKKVCEEWRGYVSDKQMKV